MKLPSGVGYGFASFSIQKVDKSSKGLSMGHTNGIHNHLKIVVFDISKQKRYKCVLHYIQDKFIITNELSVSS